MWLVVAAALALPAGLLAQDEKKEQADNAAAEKAATLLKELLAREDEAQAQKERAEKAKADAEKDVAKLKEAAERAQLEARRAAARAAELAERARAEAEHAAARAKELAERARMETDRAKATAAKALAELAEKVDAQKREAAAQYRRARVAVDPQDKGDAEGKAEAEKRAGARYRLVVDKDAEKKATSDQDARLQALEAKLQALLAEIRALRSESKPGIPATPPTPARPSVRRVDSAEKPVIALEFKVDPKSIKVDDIKSIYVDDLKKFLADKNLSAEDLKKKLAGKVIMAGEEKKEKDKDKAEWKVEVRDGVRTVVSDALKQVAPMQFKVAPVHTERLVLRDSTFGGETFTLTRTSYRMPAEKAKALDSFLREQVHTKILETKVDGDGLVVTTTPEIQATIGQIVGLMTGKPEEVRGRTRNVEVKPRETKKPESK
jgi:hypothetical protein